MKKVWLTLSSLVLLLVLAGVSGCSAEVPAIAQTPAEVNVNVSGQQEGIFVNGTGVVTVKPDIATLRLGVESQQSTVEVAHAEASRAMNDIIEVLKDNGIAEKDIQTQYFNIQRVTRWDNDRQQENLIGFRVTNIVNARIRDMEEIGAVIDAVAAAAGNVTRIDGITFSVEDPEQYHEEARNKAITDARERAEQMAQLAGVKLGKPIYITESSYQPPVYRQAYAEAVPAPAAAPTPISAGEMDITLNVQIVYGIAD